MTNNTVHNTLRRGRWAIAMSAATLMTAISVAPAFAATRPMPGQSPMRPTIQVSPSVTMTNVKPTAPVTWTFDGPALPRFGGLLHGPLKGEALAHLGSVVVSNASGSTVYSLASKAVSFDAQANTLTFTPPATTANGVTSSVLGNETEDSVAFVTGPLLGHLTLAQRQTLATSGELSLPGQQLSDLLLPGFPGARKNPQGPDSVGPQVTRGEVSSISGSTITFFGGQSITVGSSVHVQIPGQQNAALSDLQPGQFIQIIVPPTLPTPRGKLPENPNGMDQPTLVQVLPMRQVNDTVFTTGSGVGEPVNWTVTMAHKNPSVITGDTVTVKATDSYGDPATTGSFAVSGTASPLSSSFMATKGTIINGTGSSAITDHKAQSVALTVQTSGPNAGRDDQTINVGTAAFQPGPAAKMTLTPGQSTVTAGSSDTISGVVTDQYGNPVADGTTVDLTASAGTVSSIVTTTGGDFSTGLTAPKKLTSTAGTGEAITVNAKSATGSASAAASVTANPGPVAKITLTGGSKVAEGKSETVSGTAVDQYGNPVLNGTNIVLTATGGSVKDATTNGGNFSASYTAPSAAGSYAVTASANGQSAALNVAVSAPQSGSGAGPLTAVYSQTASGNGVFGVYQWTGSQWSHITSGQGTATTARLTKLVSGPNGTIYAAASLYPAVYQWTGSDWTELGSISQKVMTMVVNQKTGQLIVGTAGGGTLTWNGSAWTQVGGSRSPLAALSVQDLTYAPDGTLYAATTDGLWTYNGSTWSQLPLPYYWGYQKNINGVWVTTNGTVYIQAGMMLFEQNSWGGWETLFVAPVSQQDVIPGNVSVSGNNLLVSVNTVGYMQGAVYSFNGGNTNSYSSWKQIYSGTRISTLVNSSGSVFGVNKLSGALSQYNASTNTWTVLSSGGLPLIYGVLDLYGLFA